MSRLQTTPTPLMLSLALAFGPTVTSADDTVLAPVTVSASALALGSEQMSTPVSVLAGDQLIRRRAATLGETLADEPGISASHFGAGASRPIIRGMDGPRVKLLSDGSEIMDASTISPDHAVALEPMLSEQIEMLRGPSALAYGGGASGGVVNVFDKRVPTAVPERGIDGSVELRTDSVSDGVAGAFEVTAGSGNLAVHAEGLKRDARDYRVGRGWDDSRVDGSYNQTETGSLGVSWVGARGYLGVAYTRQQNEYGLPGHSHEYEACHPHGNHLHCGHHGADHAGHDEHEHVDHAGTPYVELDSERWELRGELLEPFAGFTRVRLRASYTDYGHDEIEQVEGLDSIGTRFRSKASDARIELEHAPVGGWRGVLGLHTGRRDFRADGNEAYVPPTVTHRHAAFLIEEYTLADWRFEAGLRHEWQHIEVDSTERDRSHHGNSVSLGAAWSFAPQYSLGMTLSRTQRLPTAEELYAHGLHMATRSWERGNPKLKAETANNVDLTLRKLAGPTTFTVSVFHNRIDHYIHAHTLDAHEDFQLIEYTQRDASFIGIEGAIRQQIDATFGLTVFGDYVRARLEASAGDRDLPRIPAHRIGVRLDARWEAWRAEAEVYRVDRQDDIAEFESPTPGYNMVNLDLSYSGRYNGTPWQIYLKANNLGDQLAYAHSSFIKHTAPLQGRNLSVGARLSF